MIEPHPLSGPSLEPWKNETPVQVKNQEAANPEPAAGRVGGPAQCRSAGRGRGISSPARAGREDEPKQARKQQGFGRSW